MWHYGELRVLDLVDSLQVLKGKRWTGSTLKIRTFHLTLGKPSALAFGRDVVIVYLCSYIRLNKYFFDSVSFMFSLPLFLTFKSLPVSQVSGLWSLKNVMNCVTRFQIFICMPKKSTKFQKKLGNIFKVLLLILLLVPCNSHSLWLIWSGEWRGKFIHPVYFKHKDREGEKRWSEREKRREIPWKSMFRAYTKDFFLLFPTLY